MKAIVFAGVCCAMILMIINSCSQQPTADNKRAAIDSLNNIINQLKPGWENI